MRVGLDIGGTKTQAVVVDDHGQVLTECTVPSPGGADGTVASAAGAVRRVVGDATATQAPGRIDDLGVTGIGVGIPGQVDRVRGVVTNAVNLGIASLALADGLCAELGVPVVVDNDVKATALGAAHLLGYSEDDSRTLTYVNLGTGVAAATVVGGTVLRGADNLAGEIGHVVVEPGGELCGCGQQGCLETVAGGQSLDRRLRAPGGPGSVAALFTAEAAADPALQAQARRLTGAVAWALTLVSTAYGPDHLVLGGGVLRHAPGLLDAVVAELRTAMSHSSYLRVLDVADRLVVLPHDHPAGALGAALLPGSPSAAPAVPRPRSLTS